VAELGEELVGNSGLSVRWRAFSEMSPSELYDALGLRQAVFVVEQNCAFLDADGFDVDAIHGLGHDGNGRLVAVARILPPGSKHPEPSIGRVAVAADGRRYGYGRAIMAAAMAEVQRLYPRSPVKIDAQAYLEKFYGSFGFVRSSEPYDEDGILHIAMTWHG
jgi:ElaA protein